MSPAGAKPKPAAQLLNQPAAPRPGQWLVRATIVPQDFTPAGTEPTATYQPRCHHATRYCCMCKYLEYSLLSNNTPPRDR